MKNSDSYEFSVLRAILTLLLASLLLSGCASTGYAPMQSLSYPRDEVQRQPNLLVLIRGLGADHAIFAKEGVVDEIRDLGLPFDVIAPNAHFGYYRAETFVQRLKEDVIEPARRQGYEQIWLAGFSMGGLGSLIYLRSHPEDIDGVLLTSPFLGWPGIHSEIQQAGGITEWVPNHSDPKDWQRMIWSWISQQDFNSQVPIWLAYGENDIVTRAGPPLLATALPASSVFSAPGNHSVATLKTLFRQHLTMLASQRQPVPVVLSSGEKSTSTF
ncbi:MAG: alpha/beta hydrolase [Dechloromonas sp.]|nr:alpha/beta hydrolase [Dechloromonas sp.]